MGNPGGVAAGCESDVSAVGEVTPRIPSLVVNFKCQFDTTQNFGGTESQLIDQRACLWGIFLIDGAVLGSTMPLGRRSQTV